MEWKDDLQILRAMPNFRGIKGQMIRLIYNIIDEHKDKDFKDLPDLMNQIYPPREEPVVQPVGAGIHVRGKGNQRKKDRRRRT